MTCEDMDAEWDTRPLPPGWSLGYDEENQRCCYFHYDTKPPSISYTHPLDIDPGTNSAQMPFTTTNTRRSSRPLPRPPDAAPAYEPAPLHPPQKQPLSPPSPVSVILPLSSPPTYSTFLPPHSPKRLASTAPSKLKPQRSLTMQSSPRAKMSAAQQLYASSFATRGPSLPSLPPPSLQNQSPSHVTDRNALYKTQVASYIQPAPAGRPRSPASTSSSLSSRSPQLTPSPYFRAPFEPLYLGPPSSDEEPQTSTTITNVWSHISNTSHPRGRPGSDGHFRPSINDSAPQPMTDNNLNQSARNLFSLTYVDVGGNNLREVKTMTMTVKPPPNSKEPDVAHAGSHISNMISPQNTASSPPPSGSILFGASSLSTGATPSAAHLPIHPTIPTSPPLTAQPTSAPISPPLPPPLPGALQQHYNTIASVHPQHSASPWLPAHQQSPQLLLQQLPQQHSQQHIHPQYQYTDPQNLQQQPPRPLQISNPRPTSSVKPIKQPSGLFNSFARGFSNALGKTAAHFGTQAVLSSVGPKEDPNDENGRASHTLTSGFGSGTGGGGPILAPPPGSVSPPAGGQYTPSFSLPQDLGMATTYRTDSGAHYGSFQHHGAFYPAPFAPSMVVVAPAPQTAATVDAEHQTNYSSEVQYTPSNVQSPTIEHYHHSGGNNHGGQP